METLLSILEMPDFQKFARRHLKEDEHNAIVDSLAANPLMGDILQGAGGLRKARFAAKSKGKSGGVRVIYYYHDYTMPLLLITGFAKNEVDNVSKAERNMFKKLLPEIIAEYKRGHHD